MRVQQHRRDPMPTAWEIPAIAITCWAWIAAVAVVAGQGAAAVIAGGGWFVWPTHPGQALAGLVTGHPGHGMAGTDAAALAGHAWTYTAIAVIEALWVVIGVVAATRWWQTLGPGVQHGMADGAAVAKTLGISNLRRRRRLIRPDLYPPRDRHRLHRPAATKQERSR